MSTQLTPKQSLFLWNMLASENPDAREPMQSKAKPDLDSKERKDLVDRGFVSTFKRHGKRGTFLALTDQAWAWAAETVDVELMNSQVGAKTLEGLLRRLLPFLQRNEIPLAALFAETKPTARAGSSERRRSDDTRTESLWPKIEAACLSLGSGARKQRVHLRALRERLGELDRGDLDHALIAAQRLGRVVLYREDNSAALTPEDQAAALLVGSAPRHIVYLED